MKIIISESQYSKLISQITGKEMKQNFFSVIKNLLNRNKDQKVGDMILQSVKEGNYELESIDQKSARFTINSFPIEVKRNPIRLDNPESFNKNKYYALILPLINGVLLKVSVNICRDIFYEIAEEHMDFDEYLKLSYEDYIDEI